MIRRPVLAPGLAVLAGPAGVLQVGFTADYRHRLPDTPAIRQALQALSRGESLPAERGSVRVRELLGPVLRDADSLGRPGISGSDAAAVILQHPESARDRLSARARARVEVIGDLGIDVSGLLAAVGLSPAGADEPPSAVLHLSRGEPARDQLDELTHDAIAHLLVRVVESEVVVGPFVLPGRTACVRCCDLHRSDREPGYARQLRDAIHDRRNDGVPRPVDTALAWTALGRAVGDLIRYVEGDHPLTWSTTLRVEAASEVPSITRWTPHPDCSCTWVGAAGRPAADDAAPAGVGAG